MKKLTLVPNVRKDAYHVKDIKTIASNAMWRAISLRKLQGFVSSNATLVIMVSWNLRTQNQTRSVIFVMKHAWVVQGSFLRSVWRVKKICTLIQRRINAQRHVRKETITQISKPWHVCHHAWKRFLAKTCAVLIVRLAMVRWPINASLVNQSSHILLKVTLVLRTLVRLGTIHFWKQVLQLFSVRNVTSRVRNVLVLLIRIARRLLIPLFWLTGLSTIVISNSPLHSLIPLTGLAKRYAVMESNLPIV